MESINNLLIAYENLANKYGYKDSFKALKTQYCDICSKGDIIINEILNGIQSNDKNYYKNLVDKYKDETEFMEHLIKNYIIDTIENFYENGLHPDPFWAD